MSSPPPQKRPSYAKPWLSHQDQVALLLSRGLVIADPTAARAFLSHVNYYRFSELFVAHFSRAYAEYPNLPIWMLTELISFGTLTRMYRGMHKSDQSVISSRYRIQPLAFGTVLLHLVYVRNLCAHHSRLWDRVWSVKPELPRAAIWQPPHVPSNDRLFPTLLLTYHLLRHCTAVGTFPAEWKDRLHALLGDPPKTPVALAKIGMPADWNQHPIWTS